MTGAKLTLIIRYYLDLKRRHDLVEMGGEAPPPAESTSTYWSSVVENESTADTLSRVVPAS